MKLPVNKWGLALGVLLLVACGPRMPERPEQMQAYPTPLVVPADLDGDFALEQEVTMEHPRGNHSFRGVLQKQGETLTLLILGPHGGRAFALTQVGEEISFQSWMPQELPFPPEYILHDVHRAWFLSAGQGSAERDGERIEEREENGRIVERRFARLDGQPAGEIVVTYGEGLAPGAPVTSAPPEEVVLDNGWFGYRAIIRTLSWQAL